MPAVPLYASGENMSVTVNGVALPCRNIKPKISSKGIDVSNSKSGGWQEMVGGRSKISFTMEVVFDAAIPELSTTTAPHLAPGSIIPYTIKRSTSDPGFSGNILITDVDYSIDVDDALVFSVTAESTGVQTVPAAAFTLP